MKSEIIKKAAEYLKSAKGLTAAISVLCIGLLLVFAGGKLSEKPPGKIQGASWDTDLAGYTAQLEEKLTGIVSDITGMKGAKVMIALEGSFENVFASNASVGGGGGVSGTRTTQKELAFSSTKDNGDMPVIVKQVCPKIKGVAIVCSGGDDAVIKEKIIGAASTVFHVSTNRIYVTGGN